jgi:serine/threonine protein kinase
MSDNVPGSEKFSPPMSSFSGPVGELIGRRLLSPPPRPGVLATLAQYEILRILGGGGMGVVFLARDPDAARDVAIKLVKPELASDEQVVRRFLKEASHMQKLRHPNIVPVLDVSESAQGAYFVMPYFEGGNLSKWIQPGGKLDRDMVLNFAVQVAEGLQFAHRRGIIHRDLKPTNILIGGNSCACLADFGLARTVFNDSIVDVEGQQCEGTAPYMSPAVAAGQAEDTRCDIYAFGALLYEMLTADPPYTGRNTREIRLRILTEPPKPILTINPEADHNLATIAEAAMGRELRDRYADMADILADLHRIQQGKSPVGPHGVTRKVRSKLHGSWKNPKLLWAAGVSIIILGLSWTAWKFLETNHATPQVAAESAASSSAQPSPISFLSLSGLGTDAAGNIYAADRGRFVIFKINPSGSTVPFAGHSWAAGNDNGTGDSARFSILRGLAVGPTNDLFLTDGYTVRTVTAEGRVITLAGAVGFPGYVNGPTARFWLPSGIAVDRTGDVYIADSYTIRRISTAGIVSALAGSDGHAGSDDGIGVAARFSDQAKAVAVDSAGNVFVADSLNCTIRRITPNGVVTTVAGFARAPGGQDGWRESARFNRPGGIAVDLDGTIYVADTYNNTIRKITPLGQVTTFAGLAGQQGDQDGIGLSARFALPLSMALDRVGNLYVADSGNRAIRIINRDGQVTTMHPTITTAAGF